MPDSKDTIYYQEGPRCVLLLHGFVGSIQEIGRTARALRKAGYSVYAFNLAGHGTKPVGDLFEVHPNEWIQQVDEAIQFLEDEGYEQIAIMGLSLGGILALNAAQKYPNHFTGIGAFNSPCINGLDPTPIRRYITSSIRRILSHRKWSDEDIQQEVESLTPLMNQQIEQIDELIIGVRDNLPKVTTPTYIAKSIQDELIDPKTQDDIASKLTHATVHLDSFQDGRHVITTSPAFRDFQEALIDYLDQLAWA
ncbi:MAG TPA: alpha/beta fold hydrolase [Facklamia tabacinasalis]|nr:alpha/beta fold hydrolase [Ruoffia tabacinasalis]